MTGIIPRRIIPVMDAFQNATDYLEKASRPFHFSPDNLHGSFGGRPPLVTKHAVNSKQNTSLFPGE